MNMSCRVVLGKSCDWPGPQLPHPDSYPHLFMEGLDKMTHARPLT